MNRLLAALATLSLLAAPAFAAPCRDAKGKFTKCPAAAPAKAERCRDAKGKFIKCKAPDTKPM